jgi:hypothetical protein
MRYGYVSGETLTGHPVVVGPFNTLEETQAHAGEGQRVVDWADEPPGPGRPCPDCGATFERLPMPADTARVYDELFPEVLAWSEEDDCGMATLMRDVAEAAAAVLRTAASAGVVPAVGQPGVPGVSMIR